MYMRAPVDISLHVNLTMLPPEAQKNSQPLRSSVVFSNHYEMRVLGVAMMTVFPILSCQS